ncbi:alkaline phosphatase family protein [Phenylobacterium sp.]|uniref:alkaline phosphatase family protein n=1 Tax=Phenylobacterium sp. TaxID=1871053 RepID=UPI001220F3DE|nr:alkaline phosphatase family protein [Phenylobacterium sp.]THD59788.1 MAG: phosphoesterase [Phenylobacterium sp.]
MRRFFTVAAVAAGLVLSPLAAPAAPTAGREGVPHYDHVFVILEENKDYGQIMSPASAPNIAGLAVKYGDAAQFFAEVHPSEANYVALLGGDTFGIHDDDAYYCDPGSTRPFCGGAKAPGYATHRVQVPHLGDQLLAIGLTWKGYYENLPEPGSGAVIAGDPKAANGMRTASLYASKHSGFMNFASVQDDPHRAERIVGFDQLDRDLASGQLPNFALIVPNQCNEMHGLHGDGVPADCDGNTDQDKSLIRRGDAYTGELVRRLQATPAWASKQNMAIIITFDEGSGGSVGGCCGIVPGSVANYGGGHIPTVVITNHGPRGVKDETPYSHYSLLRTLEDAFGVDGYLGHAKDTDAGVRPMVKLFAVGR